MSTHEQLEAEAEKLYPITKALDVEHTAIVIAHRSAYVRAKTVSAEQVEAAAEALKPGPSITGETAIRHCYYVDKARRTLEAAGFYVMEDDDVSRV